MTNTVKNIIVPETKCVYEKKESLETSVRKSKVSYYMQTHKQIIGASRGEVRKVL